MSIPAFNEQGAVVQLEDEEAIAHMMKVYQVSRAGAEEMLAIIEGGGCIADPDAQKFAAEMGKAKARAARSRRNA